MLEDDHIEGTWKILDSGDDDLVGFVFGYQDSSHYYLFDWKKTDQQHVGFAAQGMTVKVVNATPPIRDVDLWPTAGNGTRVTTLFHNSIPWQSSVTYRFLLDVHPGSFTITVQQGTQQLASFTIQDSTYGSGKFGFYNYSEGPVQYTGFQSQRLNDKTYRYDVDATDADGDTVAYSLDQAPAGMTIDPATGVITWPVTMANVGTHPVSVRAQDAGGLFDIQTFTLNIAAENQAPAVSAGPDQTVTLPDSLAIEASVDDDGLPAGAPLVCNWSRVSGSGTVTFAPSTSPSTTATFSGSGTYVLRLTCGDSVFTSSDDMGVTVLSFSPNQPPAVACGADRQVQLPNDFRQHHLLRVRRRPPEGLEHCLDRRGQRARTGDRAGRRDLRLDERRRPPEAGRRVSLHADRHGR